MKYTSRLFTFRMLPALALFALLFMLSACSSPAATTTIASESTTLAATTTEGTTETAAVTTSGSMNAIQKITPDEAKTMLAGDSGVTLLDVRTAEEYATGHIAGSQLLPYDEIAARADELPTDLAAPIIVYCRSGRRSALAASTLAGLGYTAIYDLGGIQDWPYETVID